MKKGELQHEPAMRFVFIGEKPSSRAVEIGASWTNGRLAAKTLHDALRACGIEPSQQQFLNLFGDDPGAPTVAKALCIRRIRELAANGHTIVALGQKVSRALSKCRIAHLRLVHPAARGSIRKKSRYQEHVAAQLATRASHSVKGETPVMPIDDVGSEQKAA
jgi:hypothetical protein